MGPGNSLTVLGDCKELKPIKQALLALKASSRFMLPVLRKHFSPADPQKHRQDWQAGLQGHSRTNTTAREASGPCSSHALLQEPSNPELQAQCWGNPRSNVRTLGLQGIETKEMGMSPGCHPATTAVPSHAQQFCSCLKRSLQASAQPSPTQVTPGTHRTAYLYGCCHGSPQQFPSQMWLLSPSALLEHFHSAPVSYGHNWHWQ